MWNSIIGQENIKKIFNNIIKSGKFANAYIFYGNDGVGKDAVAVELAKILNCSEIYDKFEACDNCRYCRQIKSLHSPLIKYITALPTGKKNSENEDPVINLDSEDYEIYIQELHKKSNDLYYKISIPDANSIRIDSIRNLINESNFTIEQNKKKFFIISECDKMNDQSSNSLLKILEEPPKNSHFILTTSKPYSLLPTIWGRCQKIKFNNIRKNEIINYIKITKPEILENEINLITELSNGSISLCKEILDSYFLELREDIINLIRFIIQNKYIDVHKYISKIIAVKDKAKYRQAILLMILWFRDISMNLLDLPEYLTNKDKSENIKKYNSRFISENHRIIRFLENAIKDIDKNINPEILFYNISFGIKKLITERT